MMPNSRALRAAWGSPGGGGRCGLLAGGSPVRARVSAVRVLPLTAASRRRRMAPVGTSGLRTYTCSRLGCDVNADGVEGGAGDLLGAVENGLDRGAADEAQQAADHAAGAAVQVLLEPGQGTGLVAVQAEAVFQGGDQPGPGVAAGERAGPDHAEAPGDLLAAGAGQQPGALDVDAGVDERGRDPLGEVLEHVGCLGAGTGGEADVVDLIHFTDRRE